MASITYRGEEIVFLEGSEKWSWAGLTADRPSNLRSKIDVALMSTISEPAYFVDYSGTIETVVVTSLGIDGEHWIRLEDGRRRKVESRHLFSASDENNLAVELIRKNAQSVEKILRDTKELMSLLEKIRRDTKELMSLLEPFTVS